MQINFFNLLWIFFIIMTLVPAINRRLVEMSRQRLMRAIEKKRGSRLITLIHRQEALSFLGIAFSRYIDIEDSEQVLRAIRLTPDDMPIDIVLHTPGGLVLAAEQIAHALVKHKAKVTVFVPHYAMSGGTFVALAADEIVMEENAVLGPVDPQLGKYPAASILTVSEVKDINEMDDETLILADIARKAQKQVRSCLVDILTANDMPLVKAEEVADTLSCGQWTHDYPLIFEEAKELGLPVSSDLPNEVYQLMELYPQAAGRRPSVEYIPLPYRREEPPEKK
ncbi:MAG: ATP-dependent Clp protease proteolytic subunit [Anaerolineae bacterium]